MLKYFSLLFKTYWSAERSHNSVGRVLSRTGEGIKGLSQLHSPSHYLCKWKQMQLPRCQTHPPQKRVDIVLPSARCFGKRHVSLTHLLLLLRCGCSTVPELHTLHGTRWRRGQPPKTRSWNHASQSSSATKATDSPSRGRRLSPLGFGGRVVTGWTMSSEHTSRSWRHRKQSCALHDGAEVWRGWQILGLTQGFHAQRVAVYWGILRL